MKTGTQLELLFFVALACQTAGVYILANLGTALILGGTELGAITLWGMSRLAGRSASS